MRRFLIQEIEEAHKRKREPGFESYWQGYLDALTLVQSELESDVKLHLAPKEVTKRKKYGKVK